MKCYLSLPSYDQRHWSQTMMSVLNCLDGSNDGLEVFPDPINGSLLPRVFNEALGRAIVRGADVFAMLHADIGCEPGWLSKMWRIMDATGADVLSAVVALKDNRELTSTAIAVPQDPYRKLTLNEVHGGCPETFDRTADYLLDQGASRLLLNTGVMLMRLDRPWLRKWNGFQIRSRIQWQSDGGVLVDTTGEDWDMSEQLSRLPDDPLLMATTAVRVLHFGSAAWGNWPSKEAQQGTPEAAQADGSAGPPQG